MTSTSEGDGGKPGWFQRTFGADKARPELERLSQQLTERDARLLVLENELASVRAAAEREAADALDARIATLVAQQALDEQRCAAAELEARLAERGAQVAELQSHLDAEAERVKRQERAAASALQRADQRGAEVVAERKKLMEAEARFQQLAQRLQADQTRLQTELGEQLAAIARLQHTERGQRAELQERDRRIALIELERERWRGSSEALQAELRRIVQLSAQALDVVLGPALPLAVELGFRALGSPAPKFVTAGAAVEPEPAQRVRDHLVGLGLAEDFRLVWGRDSSSGSLRLAPWPGEGCPDSLARWLTAYATECWNAATLAEHRVERIAGGPEDFDFRLTPRAEAALDPATP